MAAVVGSGAQPNARVLAPSFGNQSISLALLTTQRLPAVPKLAPHKELGVSGILFSVAVQRAGVGSWRRPNGRRMD